MPKNAIFFSGLRCFEKYTILNTSDTLSYFQFSITYFTPIQRHFGCMSAEIRTWSHPSHPSAKFKISARRSQVTGPARLNELVQYYVDFIIHVCFVWVCMYLTIGLRTLNQLAWAWDWCDLHFPCYIKGTNTHLQRYYYFDKSVMMFLYRWASMYLWASI